MLSVLLVFDSAQCAAQDQLSADECSHAARANSRIVNNHWQSCCVGAVAQLELADLLATGPVFEGWRGPHVAYKDARRSGSRAAAPPPTGYNDVLDRVGTSVAVGMLKPNLDTLPSSQRLLWRELGPTPRHFVLYGGTALALRLGHRESVDFDFFSNRPFQPFELLRSIPYLANQRATQQAENTLSCSVETAEGEVTISFFGGLPLRQIEVPDLAESNRVSIASLLDLFGTKCVTIAQRSESKDYRDIHALLTRTSLTLPQGIAAAREIYGRQYDPLVTLQALSYFADLAEQLDETTKADLLAAVGGVSLQDLPTISGSSEIGGASPRP